MSKMSFRRLSFRQVLFVLSGILVHYVGYYSFYRVYSFITSGIIRFIGYTHSLCRISLRRISLRRISLRRVSLRRVSLRRVSLRQVSLRRISLRRISLRRVYSFITWDNVWYITSLRFSVRGLTSFPAISSRARLCLRYFCMVL